MGSSPGRRLETDDPTGAIHAPKKKWSKNFQKCLEVAPGQSQEAQPVPGSSSQAPQQLQGERNQAKGDLFGISVAHGIKFLPIPRSSSKGKGQIIQVWDDVCERNIWSRHQFYFSEGKRCQRKGEEFSRGWDEGVEPDLPNLPAWNGRNQCSHQAQAPKKAWDLLWEGQKDTAQCPDTATRVCHRLSLDEHRDTLATLKGQG